MFWSREFLLCVWFAKKPLIRESKLKFLKKLPEEYKSHCIRVWLASWQDLFQDLMRLYEHTISLLLSSFTSPPFPLPVRERRHKHNPYSPVLLLQFLHTTSHTTRGCAPHSISSIFPTPLLLMMVDVIQEFSCARRRDTYIQRFNTLRKRI